MTEDLQSVREPAYVVAHPPELGDWWPDGCKIWCRPPRWLLVRIVQNKLIEHYNAQQKKEKKESSHGR